MRSMLSLIGIYAPSRSNVNRHKPVTPKPKVVQQPPKVEVKSPKTADQLNQDRLLALHNRFWKPPLRLKSS